MPWPYNSRVPFQLAGFSISQVAPSGNAPVSSTAGPGSAGGCPCPMGAAYGPGGHAAAGPAPVTAIPLIARAATTLAPAPRRSNRAFARVVVRSRVVVLVMAVAFVRSDVGP